MLNKLKVLMEAENDNVYDMIATNLNDDDIKDYFLDKINPNLDGDENIKQIIDAIPADGKNITKDDIKKILESVVPVNLNALGDSEYDNIMESHYFEEGVVTEGNAWSMYVETLNSKECEKYNSTIAKAKAAYKAKDMKKANRYFRDAKSQLPGIVKLADKISSDNLSDKFAMVISTKMGAIRKKDSVRRNAKAQFRCCEIYLEYMIEKTDGKKVGLFKDYVAKAIPATNKIYNAKESADGIDYIDSDDFDDKFDESEILYNDMNEALDTYDELVAEQTLSLTESMDAMIADLDNCIGREW